MMNFRVLKANLETILIDAAASRYQVVGHQVQGTGAKETLNNNRRVQVFYGSGDFPKSNAAITGGPTQHDITYRIELTVSAASKGDLTVINNQGSTPAQIAAAIAAFESAASEADALIDEFFEVIYQILMDSRNSDIGTVGPPYTVSSRWVSGMQKDDPLPRGEYVTLTGAIAFTCMAVEIVTGDVGIPAGDGPFNQTTDLDGDDNEKTGVTV